MSEEIAVPVVGVAKKELALRVADAVAENTELTETVEKLRAELVTLRTEITTEEASLRAEIALLVEEREAAIKDADTLREKLAALRAALTRDGKVLDIKCRTMSELYVRETIEQRLRGVLQVSA
jgi:ribosomal protein L29